MTSHRPPLLPDVPESTVNELHALYREGADAEPSPLLDQRILAAACAELHAGVVKLAKMQAPWWKRWLVPTSAIAVAVLGVSLTWRVVDQQERDLQATMNSTEVPSGNRADVPVEVAKTAPAMPLAESQALAASPPAKKARAESKLSQRSPSLVQDQTLKAPVVEAPNAFPSQETAKREADASGLLRAPSVSAPTAMAAPTAASAAAPVVAPAPASEMAKQEQRAKTLEPPEARTVNPTVSDDATLPAPAAARSQPADSSAGSAAKFPDDAATPEAWFTHIRELRAGGRNAEAVQSLARFRGRYPDHLVPSDLIDLK